MQSTLNTYKGRSLTHTPTHYAYTEKNLAHVHTVHTVTEEFPLKKSLFLGLET